MVFGGVTTYQIDKKTSRSRAKLASNSSRNPHVLETGLERAASIDPLGFSPYQPSSITELEEAILQGNVDAVETLTEAAGLPSDQASAAVARAAANANKLNHIFGKASHNLDGLVRACGSPGKALQNILEAGAKNFSKVPNGVATDIVVTINGVQ